jgi:hypothetical protein
LLLHADAEPVLQLVERGEAALVEGLIPRTAQRLPGPSAQTVIRLRLMDGSVLSMLLVSSAPRTHAAGLPKMPAMAARATWQAELGEPRAKAHSHEGDATAAARRWLPTVAVDPAAPPIGGHNAS